MVPKNKKKNFKRKSPPLNLQSLILSVRSHLIGRSNKKIKNKKIPLPPRPKPKFFSTLSPLLSL
ncbi:hypothetical protein QJS10_CPA06g00965 [Acorus calamus]|uniref:Uncharacterized protein n=1 Tax=Acorus calamus TaxID=4465 RepID=A0AAV9EJL7_ACOCL|nr:hypothetical protein QJS10_CPA06g00965 [Acorus calamus]